MGSIAENLKEVLIDLTCRGDYTGTKDKRGNTRKLIVPAVYKDQKDNLKGVDSQFYKVLKNQVLWKTTFGVDGNRFTTRRDYL